MSLIETLGEYGGIKFLPDGKLELSFLIPKERCSSILAATDKAKEKKLSIKVSEYRKRRSLDANAYMWVLCDKLAEKLNITKDEVYRQHIKDIGVFRTVEIDEKAADTLIHSWGLHGTGWIAERLDHSKHEGFTIIALYYGSSTYNTKQMSRLINGIVEDCKDQGIETLTPDELQQLKEAWNVER